MRKTPKNRSTEFPPSAAAAERLADYKGEGHPLGMYANFYLLLIAIKLLICFYCRCVKSYFT